MNPDNFPYGMMTSQGFVIFNDDKHSEPVQDAEHEEAPTKLDIAMEQFEYNENEDSPVFELHRTFKLVANDLHGNIMNDHNCLIALNALYGAKVAALSAMALQLIAGDTDCGCKG